MLPRGWFHIQFQQCRSPNLTWVINQAKDILHRKKADFRKGIAQGQNREMHERMESITTTTLRC